MLYRFRDTASYLSKFAYFDLSLLHLVPRWERPRSNFEKIFGVRKLESLGYHCGVVCVILSIAVLVQYRLVTDRRTDGHTTTANTALA